MVWRGLAVVVGWLAPWGVTRLLLATGSRGGGERAEKSERLPQRCDAVSVDRYIWPRHRRVDPEKDGGNIGLVNTVGSGSGWVLRSGGGVVFCPLIPLLEQRIWRLQVEGFVDLGRSNENPDSVRVGTVSKPCRPRVSPGCVPPPRAMKFSNAALVLGSLGAVVANDAHDKIKSTFPAGVSKETYDR